MRPPSPSNRLRPGLGPRHCLRLLNRRSSTCTRAAVVASCSVLAKHVLTILAVDDVARAAAFYQRAFAWPIAVEVPVYVEFALPAGMRLGVYQRDALAKLIGTVPQGVPAGAAGSTELYLYVDDLTASEAALHAAGARVLSERAMRPWGDVASYFADPYGNIVVVAQPSGATASAT